MSQNRVKKRKFLYSAQDKRYKKSIFGSFVYQVLEW